MLKKRNPLQKKAKIRKKLQGVVVADKMEKTVVVLVSAVKVDPKYGKRYKRDRKYKVHDPKNKYKVGDLVSFLPSRPYSKEKRWEVSY